MSLLSTWGVPELAALNNQAVILLMLVPLVLRIGTLLLEAERLSVRISITKDQQRDM